MTNRARRNLLVVASVVTVAAIAAVPLTERFGFFGANFEEYAAAPVFTENGLAIRGYDPVAYFAAGQPVAGDPEFTAEWRGATWRFASLANRDAFQAEPEAYAPQYGGFCAWAVAAKGKLYSTQPSNWTIHEGKLYLNFNDDIQHRWEQDIPGFIADGDRRWPEILAGS